MTKLNARSPQIRTVPLMRPQLPSINDLERYLREIDKNRWYSNFGPLVTRLETRLGDLFALPPSCVVLFSNGTAALTAALLATGDARRAECILPSWTFVASAAAVVGAHMRPHFADISPLTWELDPLRLGHSDVASTGAAMVVSPFGAPVDSKRWDRVSKESGVAVVIDAAASFDAVARVPEAAPGKSPVVISLHATKAFGVGEGGLALTTCAETADRMRQISNFGIGIGVQTQIDGFNGKMSEYHAAVGLAALDAWPTRRAALEKATNTYIEALACIDGVRLLPQYGQGWVSAYCTVYVPGALDVIVERMTALGVETRRWWQRGVHAQVPFGDFVRDSLPVTDDIASHALSLPFYHDMTRDDIFYVASALQRAMA